MKVGPDFIDPAFHTAASGQPCCNLDSWAMRPATLAALAGRLGLGARLLLGEGVMGLFDGAPDGRGSTADLARLTGWPVVLVVDVRGQAASAAATVHGFASFRPDVRIAGVVFNRVGGAKHADLLRRACAPLEIPVLGCLPRQPDLAVPDRHLGLVQAAEHADLEGFVERAADFVAEQIDTAALAALAGPAHLADAADAADAAEAVDAPIAPLGQRIAVARDIAFSFAYPFILEGWRRRGAEIAEFSPLADEPPPGSADAVYLPGGYPELHAGRLAANQGFRQGMQDAARRGAAVYGECGGYMVLGQGIVDAEGDRHAMLGLLPVETSFARRRLHLGYRSARLLCGGPLGAEGQTFRGHEFHFASVLSGEADPPLFSCSDAAGSDQLPTGGRSGSVFGSFMHLIDQW